MAIEAFFGLGLGYNYALAMKKEAEVKQGKNDYQASVYQIQGLTSFSSLVARVLSQIPYSPISTGAAIGNVMIPAAGIILCPASAAIKQGHYEQGVKCFDAVVKPYCPKLTGLLPPTLDASRVKVFSFIAEHASTITKAGVLAGTIALPFFGFGSLALGIAGPMAFQALDTANMVPTSISMMVEKYMPTVANASMLVGGGVFSQAVAVAALASGIPGVTDFAQKKVEKIFFKSFGAGGPSLEEIDAPWEEQNTLTFEQINYILDNHDLFQYEINPAHCSKPAHIGVNIPEDRNFKTFLTLFEKVNWKERYNMLKPAFRDDDRFIDFIKEKFNITSNEAVRDNFEEYIAKLALEASVTKEEFLAGQISEQMKQFVMVLCNEKAVKGFIYDLNDAINASSQILAYLLSKSNDKADQIEIEDILVKLAIEGGDYCARGLKRTTMEICGILRAPCAYPLKTYELIIRQQLQRMRQQIMQSTYQKMIEIMVRLAKEGNGVWVSKERQTTDVHAVAIAQDVHTMDTYRQYLSLGFCPLTEHERSQFGLADFANWSMYRPVRTEMYTQYQKALDQTIEEYGEIHFCNYMRAQIFHLQRLSLEQQQALVDKLTECNEGEKTLKSFHRLFFIMQGVLKVKPIYTDWIEISNKAKDEPTPEEEFEIELSEWVVTPLEAKPAP